MARAALIHYSRTVPPDASYEREGVVVVMDWFSLRLWRENAKRIRAAGGEVLHYCLPHHDYPSGDVSADKGLFYNGRIAPYSRAAIPRNWYWDPTNPARVTVPGYNGYVMDLREGSDFADHLVDVYFPSLAADPTWEADGVMLDVVGDGYRGQTSGLRSDEIAPMGRGHVSLVTRMREKMGERFLIVNNNSWLDPHPLANGIIVERHVGGEINNSYWTGQMTRVGRNLLVPRKRNIVIANTVEEACAWANNVNDPHVTATPRSANYQFGPRLPYGACSVGTEGWKAEDNHIGGGTTPPPPPPPPAPVTRKPNPPTAVTAASRVEAPGVIVVTWAPPVPSPDIPSTLDYQIYIDDRPANLAVSATATSYALIGVAPGNHTVRVSARNVVDYGDWSSPPVAAFSFDEVVEPPPPPPPPPPPTEIEALRAEIEALKAENMNLRTVLAETNSTLNAARERADQALDQVAALQTALAEAQAGRTAANTALAAAEEKLSNSREALIEINTDLGSVIASM